MDSSPSSNGPIGRTAKGRFASGNAGGPGNPYAKQVAALRQEFFNTVKPGDLAMIAQQLIDKAKAGELAAIKELLQRLLGAPEAIDVLERMDAIERRMKELNQQ